MKIRKSIIICLIALIIPSIFMTSCSKAKSTMDDNAFNDKIESKNSNNGIPSEKIKIGVIYISDPNDGAGYTYTHHLGILGMKKNLELKNNQIVIKKNVPDSDEKATENAIEECVKKGCNIIFTTSFGYMSATEKCANKYPNIYFSHGTGYKSNGKNFNNYFGRIYQPRYLSGIAAGLKTESDKIGYVAAMDKTNSEVTGGIDAFAMGVYSVNPKAQVLVKTTNSWFDPKKEEEATKKLLDLGCDVLSQHCDTTYPLELAQKKGVWGIGYNCDMRKDVPNATLMSVVWNWSAYYTSVVGSIIDGTWDGSNYYGGMQEGVVGITDLSDFNNPEAQKKINEMSAKILDGSFNVFDGKIETNTGSIVGQEGKTLDDSTITGGINWYFKNVKIIN